LSPPDTTAVLEGGITTVASRAALTPPTVLRGSPLPVPEDLKPRNVNDKVDGAAVRSNKKWDVELAATPRQCRVVGCMKLEAVGSKNSCGLPVVVLEKSA